MVCCTCEQIKKLKRQFKRFDDKLVHAHLVDNQMVATILASLAAETFENAALENRPDVGFRFYIYRCVYCV